MKILNFSIAVFLILTLTSSCDKFRDNRNAEAAVDVALAESSFLDIARIAFNVGSLMEGATSNVDSCAVLTYQNSIGTFPNTVIVEYPNECEGIFNTNRKGKLILNYSNPLSQAGASVEIVLENFVSNNHQVEGRITLAHKGNSNNNSVFEMSVTDGVVVGLKENTVTWNALYTLERTIGESTTSFIWDDIFFITGSSNGRNTNDVDYTSEIKESLTWDITCRWPSKGVNTIKPEGRKNNELNYGEDDICDNRARVSVGGNKKNATLQ